MGFCFTQMLLPILFLPLKQTDGRYSCSGWCCQVGSIPAPTAKQPESLKRTGQCQKKHHQGPSPPVLASMSLFPSSSCDTIPVPARSCSSFQTTTWLNSKNPEPCDSPQPDTFSQQPGTILNCSLPQAGASDDAALDGRRSGFGLARHLPVLEQGSRKPDGLTKPRQDRHPRGPVGGRPPTPNSGIAHRRG